MKLPLYPNFESTDKNQVLRNLVSTYGKKFTYLGVLLEQQEDGSIHLSMPQYIEDIIQSEFGTKEYSMPADQHLISARFHIHQKF